MKLTDIEIVENRTLSSRCDEGFLRLSRLVVRNVYRDGSRSNPYPCDIVSRRFTDAVALCLYHVDEARRVKVILKEGPRAPVFLRKLKKSVVEDPRVYETMVELVAGLIEDGDEQHGGIARRAAIEAEEEAGFTLFSRHIHPLGGETFASPGISDEKIFFCSAQVSDTKGGEIKGDGGAMEEAGSAVVFDLQEAIAMCRDGRIPDMKTEVGLLRLCDQLGFIPQLGKFIHELSPELAHSRHPLGIHAIKTGE